MRDLTEDEVLGAIQSSASLQGRIKLTYVSGPYDIDRPTNVAMIFAAAIQRKFREVNAIGVSFGAATAVLDPEQLRRIAGELQELNLKLHGTEHNDYRPGIVCAAALMRAVAGVPGGHGETFPPDTPMKSQHAP